MESRGLSLFWKLLVLYAAIMAAALMLGSVSLSASQLFSGLLHPESFAGTILYTLRLPRVVGALFAGSALAVAGGLVQKLLANPLASPSVIGLQAGAGFMVCIISVLFPASAALRPAGAFLGGLLSAGILFLFMKTTHASRMGVILAGMAITQIFMAGIDICITLFPDAMNGYMDFKLGGLAMVSWKRELPGCICIALALLFAFLAQPQLDLLSLGSQTAASLGLSSGLWMVLLLLDVCLLCAGAISFAGLIGFIGLIVPHICRKLHADGSVWFLPCTAVCGALVLTFSDLLARTLFSPYEIASGILLSLAGGLFFLWLLVHERRHTG